MPRSSPRRPPRQPRSALVVAPQTLAKLAALCLDHCDLVTDIATTRREGASLLEVTSPDVLVVDVAVDGGKAMSLLKAGGRPDGLATIAVLRERGSMEAFKSGADQAIMVPFTPDELAVRTYALLRRLGRPVPLSHDQALAGLTLSLDERIDVRGRRIALTPVLNSLLYLLAANRGIAVSTADIRDLVWGYGQDTSDRTISRRMGDLRSILGRSATIRMGPRSYLLEADERR